MMRSRSPQIQANAIRQKRQVHKGCFLIVEGRDDRLFFKHFVDCTACSIMVAGGKQNVADIISILETDQFSGMVGVVDADLDHIEGHHSFSDNLIVLETVDLEALLIQSSALDRILVELGSRKKLSQFDRDVREYLITAAAWIGCLRLYSQRTDLNLRFQNLKYAKFCIFKSFSINVKILVQEVMNYSQRHDLSCEDIVNNLTSIHQSINDLGLISYGKDMIGILSNGLRKILGTNDAKNVAPDILKRQLRLAFDWDDMNKSILSQNLYKWAKQNSGYWVLNPPARSS